MCVSEAERAVTRHPGLACGMVSRVTARPKPVAQPNIPKHAPNPTDKIQL